MLFQSLEGELSAFVAAGTEGVGAIDGETDAIWGRGLVDPGRRDPEALADEDRIPILFGEIVRIGLWFIPGGDDSEGESFEDGRQSCIVFEERAPAVGFFDDAERSVLPQVGEKSFFGGRLRAE